MLRRPLKRKVATSLIVLALTSAVAVELHKKYTNNSPTSQKSSPCCDCFKETACFKCIEMEKCSGGDECVACAG